MQRLWCAALGLVVSSLFLCLAAGAEQSLAARFDFSIRPLEDGSEAFDTLIRSRDGLLIYGCVRKPPGEGPFPGVILVHGGLGGNLGATRGTALNSTPGDALVKHGYAVLSTDYRATDWVTESQDVAAAYGYFRQLPYVDPDAIAVMGGSHGGKLALEAAMDLPLQAAVAGSGLFDLAMLYRHCLTAEFHQRTLPGGGPTPSAVFVRDIVQQLGGTPDQVPDAYRQHSVISRVSEIQAPVLLAHGEQDASVPVSWTRELAAAMTEQGKTVETYFAKKGPHGFYWGGSAQGGYGVPYDAEENERFLERLIAFLERHLKKTG